MCCTDPAALAVPDSVTAALEAYERLSVDATFPDEWVRSREEALHARAPFLRVVDGAPPVVRGGTATGFGAWIHSQGFPAWVAKQVGDDPPDGLVIVRITADGRLGPVLLRPAWLIAGMSVRRHVLVTSAQRRRWRSASATARSSFRRSAPAW